MPDDPRAAPSATGFQQYLAPWYLAYLVLGVIHSGMLPFLLPLTVPGGGDLSRIAYVVGAYNLGLLPAPLLGLVAERLRLFRPVFFGGFVAIAVGLAALPQVSRLDLWAMLAALAGLGAGAVATVAPLFVVDFAPKPEWEPRIGWLQSCNGAGQLTGLLIAGAIAEGRPLHGFWLAAIFAVVAIAVGHIGLPADGRRREERLPRLDWAKLMRGFQSGPSLGGLLQQSHHLQMAGLKRLPHALGGEFGRFLLAWASVNLGIAPFFAYYPLMMQASYGVAAPTTALLYALAAGIGIGLFALSGYVARETGPRRVFQAGAALRAAGFLVLAVLGVLPAASDLFVAMLGFVLIMIAWPVLSVSSTGLAARLTPFGEGAAMGLLAATNALATVAGTFLGGPVVEALGYRIVPLIALAGLLGAELLVRSGRREL